MSRPLIVLFLFLLGACGRADNKTQISYTECGKQFTSDGKTVYDASNAVVADGTYQAEVGDESCLYFVSDGGVGFITSFLTPTHSGSET